MTDVSASVATATQTQTQSTQPTIQLQQPELLPNPGRKDISRLPAAEALRLFSSYLEMLVRVTGEVPPTAPPRTPTDPQMSGLQAEKDMIAMSPPKSSVPDLCAANASDDSPPLNAQHGAITRKFYSKLEPPISVTQYLSRLHQFCPMSTAVYLAASLYIHRLAVEQRAISVTAKNVHRLVLAGLRVATKALEDLAYPHAKVARVGGVSEAELARLEVSFCFLAGFELVIGEKVLREHWDALGGGGADAAAMAASEGAGVPTLRLGMNQRGVPTRGETP